MNNKNQYRKNPSTSSKANQTSVNRLKSQTETKAQISWGKRIKNALLDDPGRYETRLKYFDKTLTVCMFILIMFGLVFSYSASIGVANANRNLFTQFMAALLGVVVYYLWPIFTMNTVDGTGFLYVYNILLIMTLLFLKLFGEAIGGAASWIRIAGISIQPSEISKLVIILTLAKCMQVVSDDAREKNIEPSIKKLDKALLMLIFIQLLLIVSQPDFGTTSIIFLVIICMLLIEYVDVKWWSIVLVAGVLIYFIAYRAGNKYGDQIMAGGKHILERIAVFVNPFRYRYGKGYQTIQGLLGFVYGGWFGVGLGKSELKNPGRLPEPHTDFILSIIAEEAGLIGVIVVLACLFILIYRMYYLAFRSKSVLNRQVITGVATLLLIQALVNICGVLGLLPLTGVTLPFISYGGSSILVSVAMVGAVQRVLVNEREENVKESKLRLVKSYERRP